MRRASTIVAVGLALAGTGCVLLSEALAQTRQRDIVVAQSDGIRGPSVFRFLTRPFRREEAAPPPAAQPRAAQPRQQRPAAAPRQQRRTREAPARRAAPEPEIVEVEKAVDARRILVIGDFMAGALAGGLEEAFADNPNIVIVDASNGSSGLVRDDFYDWPGELAAIVQEHEPAAILALVGANDRQAIDAGNGSHVLGSEGWRSAYAGRVEAFADALRATGEPILWAGLVPVRSGSMSRDYSAFNGIYRERLDAAGIRFIETWNGFADEEGRFVAVGPDISGQATQLRAGDGINFTSAGQRKLAYFVEQEIRDILGGAVPVIAAPGETTPVEPEDVARIGPMVPLEALWSDGETLSGDRQGGASGAVGEMVVERLGAANGAAIPAGRADDYSWTDPER